MTRAGVQPNPVTTSTASPILIPVEAICAAALPEMAQTATNTREMVDSQCGKPR
jgi:hypothetical protein